jgi:hypothetical protein
MCHAFPWALPLGIMSNIGLKQKIIFVLAVLVYLLMI